MSKELKVMRTIVMAKAMVRIYQRVCHKNPMLMTSYQGDIERKGDAVLIYSRGFSKKLILNCGAIFLDDLAIERDGVVYDEGLMEADVERVARFFAEQIHPEGKKMFAAKMLSPKECIWGCE